MLLTLKTQKICIIDLGETTIGYPFFPLAACLKSTAQRYELKFDSAAYRAIHHACFSGWMQSDQDMRKCLALVEKLLPICFIFAHMRLVNATCPIALRDIPRKNRVKEAFLWFIKNMG